jgi:hypothetical protein
MEIARRIQKVYGNLLEHFLTKGRCWYELWRISNIILLDFIALLEHVNAFCPSIQDLLCI